MRAGLQEWLIRAADRRPEARAVIAEDRTFTYGEAEDFSNRLASVLREHGCERGDRVAVLMPRSALAVASFFGVLKAGCAYVPLDPDGPNVRTAEMLRQCEPTVLLAGGCEPGILEDLDSRRALGRAVIGWVGDTDSPDTAAFSQNDLDEALAWTGPDETGGDDLAYILFTSGTTGKPKGVPISHASVRAFIEWVVEYFELGSNDRLSGHTSLTCDLSTLDIYATLAAGAELHQVPKRALLIPHEVPAFIDERELTLWFSVPSQLAYVARFDALRGRKLASLRHVTWCGDVLAPRNLLYWKERLPHAVFTNMYGPTETTVASSFYRVPADYELDAGSIPIGFPCPGEELLVLDERLQPVSDGAIGDIYIGGVGLSPGYWRNDERTRSSFLPDPRSHNGNGHGHRRIYRTGDRGRLGADGALEFLGRADFQIKTAGHRVEPAEVEQAISKLPEIAGCAVVPVSVGDFTGSAIGCAYVPSNGTQLRTAELKKRLAEDLPGYMVPTRWLVLSELPTDGRGKIDRPRLQALMGG